MTYEMLTGEPPFTGATVAGGRREGDLGGTQPLTMVRRNVSPSVAAAVHRGLEKLPADRREPRPSLRRHSPGRLASRH